MAKEQSCIRERQKVDLKEPQRSTVTIYHDVFTLDNKLDGIVAHYAAT